MLAYLLDPTFQLVNTAGRPLTSGAYIEVYIAGSRDPYYCYSDFQGTLHPFKIPLDSLGSSVVLAEDSGSYDVYVYNRYGTLIMSRYNVKPGHGAGGGGGTITSSDGSIDVTMTSTGYDLKVNGQEASALRAGANDLTSDGQFVFYELVRDGDHVTVDTNGKIRLEDGWYHYDVTARVKWEDGVTVANTENHVQLYTTLNSDIIPFDCSYEHEDTLHLHGQVKITTSGSQFVVGVQGIEPGMSIELVDCGLFAITGNGDAAEYEAGDGIIIDDHEISIDPEIVQEKLTAGDNIQISEENVISATDTTYTAGTGLELDGTEFSVDTTVIQEKLTAGSNIVIEGNTISATAEPQQQADWTETDSSSVTYIQHKPQNLVQDPDYVHTDNNYTDTDKSKLDGIEAGAEANVQSNWNETNTSSDAYIQNKPDLSVYATDAELSAGLATKQDTLTAGDNITITNNVISATAAPQEQSDWTETDTSDVSYIKHKPSTKPVVAGNNITITEETNSFVISATADPQVQADWAQTDSTAVDYIQNKPDLSVYATGAELTSGLATKQDVISDLATIRSGAAAGATAVQPGDLATVATTGDYDDLTNKPDLSVYATDSELSAGLATKQDTISDLSTIRSGAAAGATAVQPGDLATVATTGDYDDLLDKPTIPSGVQLVPAATASDADKVLTVNSIGIPEWAVVPDQSTGLFQATYGTTTLNEVRDAVTANKIVYCYVSGRMAFLAFIGSTNYEFQYYRSNASSSGTDSIFVYKVSSSGWTTTERTVKAGNISYPVTQVNVNGSSAMTGTVANITIPAAPTVDQTYDASSSNAQSGTAVAGAISTKQDVISDLATIRSGAALGTTSVQPADLAPYATTSDMNTALAGKQDVISDLATIRTGAGLGATAVQPGDLATVATTGSYNDLLDLPTIPTVPVQDVQVDGVSVVSNGVAEITMPAESTVVAGSNITITEANSTITIAATVPVIGTITL